MKTPVKVAFWPREKKKTFDLDREKSPVDAVQLKPPVSVSSDSLAVDSGIRSVFVFSSSFF